MKKIRKLIELRDAFINELQNQTNSAQTEGDFDSIELVIRSLFDSIPINIVQKDYYFRSDIRNYLDKEDENNTVLINLVLEKLYNEDIISFEYLCVNNSIQETVDDVYKQKEKQ